jgi:hypothetical protein
LPMILFLLVHPKTDPLSLSWYIAGCKTIYQGHFQGAS